MLERFGNVIYWLCLVTSVVLLIVGIMTLAAVGGPLRETWPVFAG